MGTKTRSYPKFNPEADRIMAIFSKLIKILTPDQKMTLFEILGQVILTPFGLFSGPDRVPSVIPSLGQRIVKKCHGIFGS